MRANTAGFAWEAGFGGCSAAAETSAPDHMSRDFFESFLPTVKRLLEAAHDAANATFPTARQRATKTA